MNEGRPFCEGGKGKFGAAEGEDRNEGNAGTAEGVANDEEAVGVGV